MSLLKCLFYLKGSTSIATAAILFGTIRPILVLVCLIFVLWSRAWHSHTHTHTQKYTGNDTQVTWNWLRSFMKPAGTCANIQKHNTFSHVKTVHIHLWL